MIANVSGRHDGTAEVIRFVTMTLARFPGVASDDYSEHLWTRDEVAQGARFDGLTFFDHRGHYERHHSGASKKG